MRRNRRAGAPSGPGGAAAEEREERAHAGLPLWQASAETRLPHPALQDYLTPELAAPAAELNVLARVFDNLHCGDAAKLFPMDGNDRLGDCTIAALAHAITVYRGLVGHERRIMSEQAGVKLYRHLTGGG